MSLLDFTYGDMANELHRRGEEGGSICYTEKQVSCAFDAMLTLIGALKLDIERVNHWREEAKGQRDLWQNEVGEVRLELARLGTELEAAEQRISDIVGKVRCIQVRIEAGGANEDLTVATVLCSDIITLCQGIKNGK